MATILVYLNDFLTLNESYVLGDSLNLNDTLEIVETYTYEVYHSLSDIQTLQDSYTYNHLTGRTLSDTQTLQDSYFGSVSDVNGIARPIPFVSNPTETTQPSIGSPPGPGLGPFRPGLPRYEPQVVTFSWNTGSINIKAPDFGNKDTFEPKFINENSRGLTLIQYRDPIWPDLVTYAFNFSQVDYDEVQAIRIFLRQSAGKVITYTDIYDLQHVGVIPDPDGVITSSNQGYSLGFTFLEGTPA